MAKKPATKKPSVQKSKPLSAPRGKPPVVEAAVTECPRCHSTERERYFHTTERAIDGTTPASSPEPGRPFTHVVWRRTRCKSCGQVRIDRFYENRSPAKRRVA